MAVNTDDLTEIGKELASAAADAALMGTLRDRFPHLSWTRCDASDVFEEPFRTCGDFDLHLIDTSNHCVQIVSDPEQATGIALATRSATA